MNDNTAELKQALAELVELKALHDRLADDPIIVNWRELNAEYQRRKEPAWANARRLVGKE